MVARIKAKGDVGKYYWRQYVTVTGKSDSAEIKEQWKGLQKRSLDNGGDRDDKYPIQSSDKDEGLVGMIDRPGAPLDNAIPAPFAKKSDNGKEVTISVPDDPRAKAFIANLIKAANNKYGSNNTEVEFKFETELVCKDGATKTVKGTWQWGFKVAWKKEGEGAQASYAPVITPSQVKWVVPKK